MGSTDWLRSYLQKQDRFGSWAKFNYRGKAKFGTCPGGCASLLLWYFSTVFLFVQLYGFLFEPSWNERGTTQYVTEAGGPTYTIETGDFLPTFMIKTTVPQLDGTNKETINDPTIFDYSFVQYNSTSDTNTTIPAVQCEKVIQSSTWSNYTEYEKKSALSQVQNATYSLCPDASSFMINGGPRYKDGLSLFFTVTPTASFSEQTTETNKTKILGGTQILSQMINRFFTPTDYNDQGFMSFIASAEDSWNLEDARTTMQNIYVSLTNVSYYDFPIFDLSRIHVINFGQDLKVYDADYQTQDYLLRNSGQAVFTCRVVQGRKQVHSIWFILTLDKILALVGGITTVIANFLGLLIGPYENFRFWSSLMGDVYPTSPQPDEDEEDIRDRANAKQALEGTVIERGIFFYRFVDYYGTWLLKGLCCLCCIRKKTGFCKSCKNSRWWKIRKFKYDRYEDALSKLNKEIDILKHVSNQRVSEFMAKLVLQRHQRALVKSFKKYQLDDMVQEEEIEKRRDMVIESLVKSKTTDILTEPGQLYAEIDLDTDERLTKEMKELMQDIRAKFKPEEDTFDRCVLYEVTEFKDQENCPLEFWEYYEDFTELDDDIRLINVNKMQVDALPKSVRDEWMDEQQSNQNYRLSRQLTQNQQQPTTNNNHFGIQQLNGDHDDDFDGDDKQPFFDM